MFYFTQRFPCAETRNYILNKIIDGTFDYHGEYKGMVKNCCFSADVGCYCVYDNEYEAKNSGKSYIKMASLIYKWKINN